MRKELSKKDKELYMSILEIGRNSLQGITIDSLVKELNDKGFSGVTKDNIVLQYALRVAFIRGDTGQPATNNYPNLIWLKLEAMSFLQTEDALAETRKSYWLSAAALVVTIITLIVSVFFTS